MMSSLMGESAFGGMGRSFRDAASDAAVIANANAAESELNGLSSGMPWTTQGSASNTNVGTVAGGPSPGGTGTPGLAAQNAYQPPGAALSNTQGPSGFTNAASNASMSSTSFSSDDSDNSNSSWYQGLVQAAPGIISAAGGAIAAAEGTSNMAATNAANAAALAAQPTTIFGIPLSAWLLAAGAYLLLK